jgi:hypothetical protein
MNPKGMNIGHATAVLIHKGRSKGSTQGTLPSCTNVDDNCTKYGKLNYIDTCHMYDGIDHNYFRILAFHLYESLSSYPRISHNQIIQKKIKPTKGTNPKPSSSMTVLPTHVAPCFHSIATVTAVRFAAS